MQTIYHNRCALSIATHTLIAITKPPHITHTHTLIAITNPPHITHTHTHTHSHYPHHTHHTHTHTHSHYPPHTSHTAITTPPPHTPITTHPPHTTHSLLASRSTMHLLMCAIHSAFSVAVAANTAKDLVGVMSCHPFFHSGGTKTIV